MRMTNKMWKEALGGAFSWHLYDVMVLPEEEYQRVVNNMNPNWKKALKEFEDNWVQLSDDEMKEFLSEHPKYK